VAVIEHPAGAETQWDWLELPDPPAAWGWGSQAHLLVGALSHSERWRGRLCEAESFPHLVEGLDTVSRALGGLTRSWRFDRMATVVSPNTGRVTAAFAGVAKHYGVQVALCPPRRGNRKGVVEKANHVAAQRWWRTLSDDVTVEQAQASLARWCATRGDLRMRSGGADGKMTVATVAEREPRAALPAPYPAELAVERAVSAQALVSFAGNFYSVAPELATTRVGVRVRLGDQHLHITDPAGRVVLARHRLAPPGAGAMVRTDVHVHALNTAAMAAASPAVPHRAKVRIPPGAAARAAAAQLTGRPNDPACDAVVVDLAAYAAAAAGRNTLP